MNIIKRIVISACGLIWFIILLAAIRYFIALYNMGDPLRGFDRIQVDLFICLIILLTCFLLGYLQPKTKHPNLFSLIFNPLLYVFIFIYFWSKTSNMVLYPRLQEYYDIDRVFQPIKFGIYILTSWLGFRIGFYLRNKFSKN